MDFFEFNKVAMAFLGTVFGIFSLMLISESIFHAEIPEQAGYEIAAGEVSTDGESSSAATGPAYEPIEPLLASADLGAGETVFKKCASCHTWEQGGANKVGPNLWNVVGGAIGSNHPEFSYSAALKAYGAGKTWTYEELNGFMFKPRTHVKGTAMGFAGLAKVEDRANLIGWMRTHADSPAPLPGS